MIRSSRVRSLFLLLVIVASGASAQTPGVELALLCPPYTDPATTYVLMSVVDTYEGCYCISGPEGDAPEIGTEDDCILGSCLGSIGNLMGSNIVITFTQGTGLGTLGVNANSYSQPVPVGSALPCGLVQMSMNCPCPFPNNGPISLGSIYICC